MALTISPLSSLNFTNSWRPGFQIEADYMQRFLQGDRIVVQYAVSGAASRFKMRVVHSITGERVILQSEWQGVADFSEVYQVLVPELAPGDYSFQFLIDENDPPVAESRFRICERVEDTVLIRYTHRRVEFDTVFTKDSVFDFRVEGVLLPSEMKFDVKSESFRDQRYTMTQLSALPYCTQTLTVGGGMGVPNWAGDKLNRIFALSSVEIDGIPYVRGEGAAPEMTSIHADYPLFVYKLAVEQTDRREGTVWVSGRVIDYFSKHAMTGVRVDMVCGQEILFCAFTDDHGNFNGSWMADMAAYEKALVSDLEFVLNREGYHALRMDALPSLPRSYEQAIASGVELYGRMVRTEDFSISPAELLFNNQAGYGRLYIGGPARMGDLSFCCEPKADWLEVDSAAGIVVSVVANPLPEDRTTELVVSVDRYDFRVPVMQSEAESYVTVSPAQLAFDAAGKRLSGAIPQLRSNDNWHVTQKPAWLTVEPESGNGNATLSIMPFVHNGNVTRCESILLEMVSGDSSCVVTIEQSNMAHIIVLGNLSDEGSLLPVDGNLVLSGKKGSGEWADIMRVDSVDGLYSLDWITSGPVFEGYSAFVLKVLADGYSAMETELQWTSFVETVGLSFTQDFSMRKPVVPFHIQGAVYNNITDRQVDFGTVTVREGDNIILEGDLYLGEYEVEGEISLSYDTIDIEVVASGYEPYQLSVRSSGADGWRHDIALAPIQNGESMCYRMREDYNYEHDWFFRSEDGLIVGDVIQKGFTTNFIQYSLNESQLFYVHQVIGPATIEWIVPPNKPVFKDEPVVIVNMSGQP